MTVSVDLAFDEMFAPTIAEAVRARGHRVIAVAERPELRSMADDDLFGWAAAQPCWLLTENIKDFRPILLRMLQAGGPTARLLFTSSRAFPRTRRNPGPLIDAIDAWLTKGPPEPPLAEDWLL